MHVCACARCRVFLALVGQPGLKLGSPDRGQEADDTSLLFRFRKFQIEVRIKSHFAVSDLTSQVLCVRVGLRVCVPLLKSPPPSAGAGATRDKSRWCVLPFFPLGPRRKQEVMSQGRKQDAVIITQ